MGICGEMHAASEKIFRLRRENGSINRCSQVQRTKISYQGTAVGRDLFLGIV